MRASGSTELVAEEAARRRRVRRSALMFGLIAAAFYVGFIAMSLLKGAK